MEYEKVLCKLQDVVHRKGHSGGVSPSRWQQLKKSPLSSEDVLTMLVHTHHGHLFLRQRSVGKELLCRRTRGMTSIPAPPLTQKLSLVTYKERGKSIQGCCKDRTMGNCSANHEVFYTSSHHEPKIKNVTDRRKLGSFSCSSITKRLQGKREEKDSSLKK